MHPPNPQPPIFEWTARLAMLRSRVLILQLSVALGIPMLCLGLFLIVLDWPPDRDLIINVLSVLGGVFAIMVVLLALALLLVYQGGYDYHYVIDAHGIRATTTGRTAKTNRVVNTLLMLSGRPTEAGIGNLAAARQSEYLPWSEVSGFSVEANARIINLESGPLPSMIVACDAAHFAAVLEFIRSRVGQQPDE